MAPLSRNAADEALVMRARGGDDDAFCQLIDAYAPLVNSRARAFSRAGLEADDLAQEGMIGLLGAIRVYDKRQASFSTFARLCIDRMLIAAARQAGRQKRIPQERLTADFGPEALPAEDFLAGSEENNPESILNRYTYRPSGCAVRPGKPCRDWSIRFFPPISAGIGMRRLQSGCIPLSKRLTTPSSGFGAS